MFPKDILDKILSVKTPGVFTETPYGKVFIHKKKGRRYIKLKNGRLESFPRFLLAMHGVDVPKSQDIHHKNENKLDDRIENYDYSDHHDHARNHLNFMKKKSALSYTTCTSLEDFVIYARELDAEWQFTNPDIDVDIYENIDGLIEEYNAKGDLLPGGVGDDLELDDIVTKKELARGIGVELEHTDDPLIAIDIVKDHEFEALEGNGKTNYYKDFLGPMEILMNRGAKG